MENANFPVTIRWKFSNDARLFDLLNIQNAFSSAKCQNSIKKHLKMVQRNFHWIKLHGKLRKQANDGEKKKRNESKLRETGAEADGEKHN